MTQPRTSSNSAERPTARWAWFIGNVLVAGGITWLIIDRALALRYPLRWGGPNIGGGALVLLAFLAIAAGAVTLATVVVGRLAARQDGPQQVPGRGAAQGAAFGRRTWIAPVLVNVVLAAGLATVVARSGDEGPVGAVGVTVTKSGSPVLVLEVCRGSVDTVTVTGPSRGERPNEEVVRLTSQAAVTATTSVDVVRPSGRWSGSTLPSSSSTPALLIATASGPRGGLRPVSFTASDLASLDPTTVLYSTSGPSGDVVAGRAPLTGFSRLACAGTSAAAGPSAHPGFDDAASGSWARMGQAVEQHALWASPRLPSGTAAR